MFFHMLLFKNVSLTNPDTHLFAVCALGSLDVVFLVPASTDRINLARPLREFLTNTAESLRTTGALNTQVLFVKIKSHNRSGKCTTVFFPVLF